MKNLLRIKGRGIGHLGLILVVVVALVIGTISYMAYNKDKGGGSNAAETTLENAECDYDDNDLCKFFTRYKAQDNFTVTSMAESDGQRTITTFRANGDKSHLKVEGDTPYESITIGQATHTKGADGTWWKQTAGSNTEAELMNNVVSLREPAGNNPATYTREDDKESCGDMTCFKYSMTDPNQPGTTTHIWFDDSEYQLRRIQVTSEDGGKTESTYSYESVSINEPKPVKELAEGQRIEASAGASQSAGLPATGDIYAD